MSDDGPALPPKPEVAMALMQTAPSVYVHLDPRGDEVLVPHSFKKQAQLVLQVGMNMAVPIPDLDIGEEALSCTLSFNRRPEFCRIPWDAIYGLVGDDGRGMIWPESVPAEVAAAADGRAPTKKEEKKPRLRLAATDGESTVKDEPEAEEPTADESAAEEPTADEGSTADESTAEEPTVDESTGADIEVSDGNATADGPAAVDGPSKPETPPEKAQTERKLPSYLRVVK